MLVAKPLVWTEILGGFITSPDFPVYRITMYGSTSAYIALYHDGWNMQRIHPLLDRKGVSLEMAKEYAQLHFEQYVIRLLSVESAKVLLEATVNAAGLGYKNPKET